MIGKGELEKMKVREFLKTLVTDPKARELLKGREEPKDGREAIRQYAEIAKELGISVSQKGLEAFLEAREKLQRKKTEEAGSAVREALSEDSLSSVAGGADICSSTYESGEWCWVSDSCSAVITGYTLAPDEDELSFGEITNPYNEDSFLHDWAIIEKEDSESGKSSSASDDDDEEW